MADEPVILALGGGAAKGLAHVGVLRGLEEDGVPIAGVAGTSMGSIVGALFARGMSAGDMTAFFEAVDWSRLGWIMARSIGGAAFGDLVRETLGSGLIEDLDLPFAAVCCDLGTGEEVVLRSGSLEQAVRASSAIPGLLPPIKVDGRNLVDGALVTPVPAAAAETLGDHDVLAVNVLRLAAPSETSRAVVGRLLGAAAPAPVVDRLHRLVGQHRHRLRKREPVLPGRLDVLMRSSHVMQYNLSRLCDRSTSGLEPELGDIGWFDFHLVGRIMNEGYRAYRESRSEGC